MNNKTLILLLSYPGYYFPWTASEHFKYLKFVLILISCCQTPLTFEIRSSETDNFSLKNIRTANKHHNQNVAVGAIITARCEWQTREKWTVLQIALERLHVKSCCTDTSLPTEGSAALRSQSSLSTRSSDWRVLAVSERASYSCDSFWDTVSSCTLRWRQEAVDSHREAALKYGANWAARAKWSLQLSSPCYYGLETDWWDHTEGRLEETRVLKISSRLWQKGVLYMVLDLVMPVWLAKWLRKNLDWTAGWRCVNTMRRFMLPFWGSMAGIRGAAAFGCKKGSKPMLRPQQGNAGALMYMHTHPHGYKIFSLESV